VNNDALIQGIINEYRIEFSAEGLQWKDIHCLAVEGKYVQEGIPNKVAPTGVALISIQLPAERFVRFFY